MDCDVIGQGINTDLKKEQTEAGAAPQSREGNGKGTHGRLATATSAPSTDTKVSTDKETA